MSSVRRVVVVVALLVGLLPAPARADWLIIPHVGLTFGGGTALIDLEAAAGTTKATVGGAVMVIGDGIFGLDADVAFVPGFFERGRRGLVTDSRVTTAGAHLVLALPLSVTRESLRPYLIAGGGTVRATANDILSVLDTQSWMPALTAGVGALGFVSDMTGVRFDLRYTRSIGEGDDLIVTEGARLRMWRGSLGFVIRF